MRISYDFHIHTTASPCGDEAMTLNNIINLSYLLGKQIIVLAEGSEPTADMLEKAQENGIPILASSLSSFEIVYRFGMDQALGGIG